MKKRQSTPRILRSLVKADKAFTQKDISQHRLISQPITQEHGTGCAVACAAFVLNLSYRKALNCFSKPEQAWGRGFYCKEVIQALAAGGKRYSCHYIKKNKRSYLKIPGTIVYIGRSPRYPVGHYLVRTKSGNWMNPWINFPVIAPAKSAFQKRLPGKPLYAIFPI